jgi:hypothetical protein
MARSVRKYVRTLAELGAESGCSVDLDDGGKGDFTVGEHIFITMSELRLGSGLSVLKHDLYRQITLRTDEVP